MPILKLKLGEAHNQPNKQQPKNQKKKASLLRHIDQHFDVF